MQGSQQVVQGDELVQGQNHTAEDLLGHSDLLCSQQNSGAGSDLPMSFLAQVFMLKRSPVLSCPGSQTLVFPVSFFCTLNLFPLFTCVTKRGGYHLIAMSDLSDARLFPPFHSVIFFSSLWIVALLFLQL